MLLELVPHAEEREKEREVVYKRVQVSSNIGTYPWPSRMALVYGASMTAILKYIRLTALENQKRKENTWLINK